MPLYIRPVDLTSNQTVGGTKTFTALAATTTAFNLQVGQIAFPATQNPSAGANTLDDYEKGTWTPSIAGSGTAGTPTYVTRVGSYTKIGNRVYFECYVTWTNITGATGGLIMTGLPFTSGATYLRAVAAAPESMTLNGAAYYFAAYVGAGATHVTLANLDGNGNTAAQPIDTSAGLMLSGNYLV